MIKKLNLESLTSNELVVLGISVKLEDQKCKADC